MKAGGIHLIINKQSRQGRASLAAIISSLRSRGLEVAEIHEIKGDNLAALCRKALKANPNLLLIGGGDGTVSQVLHHLAGSKVEIGIIPLGTTNNFGRSLNLPSNVDEAISLIMRTQAHPVDLGIVNGQYFANVVGLGLSTDIARRVSHKAKQRFGRLAYALVGLSLLFKHRPFVVTISDKDGELESRFETHQVVIANGRFHAGRQITADAAVDDQQVIVVALGGHTLRSFIWHSLDFYLGRRKELVHSPFVTGKSIRISTDRQLKSETDGELGPTTPLNISVEPKSVLVRYKL